jgi:hypothetical protein
LFAGALAFRLGGEFGTQLVRSRNGESLARGHGVGQCKRE